MMILSDGLRRNKEIPPSSRRGRSSEDRARRSKGITVNNCSSPN